MKANSIKEFAALDGFRCYKVKNRGDSMGDRLYIAPVYVIGLPGDVDNLNKEMETPVGFKPDFADGVKVPMTDEQKKLNGECLEI